MTMVMNVTESADFEQQYRALQHGKAFCVLAGWSSISIRGKDRQAFLHNFCTNDVKRLVPGTSCEAFVTNVKGKIVGHGLIGCADDELSFIGAPGQAAAIDRSSGSIHHSRRRAISGYHRDAEVRARCGW